MWICEYVNMWIRRFLGLGFVDCLELWLLFYTVFIFHSSGALGSPDLLPSCSLVTFSMHITIILIISLTSIKFQPCPKSLLNFSTDQLINGSTDQRIHWYRYISGIQFLPVCIMYMGLCPEGAEGASYAMLTTFGNIALSCANSLGNVMASFWGKFDLTF